jgi:hypothetical protein
MEKDLNESISEQGIIITLAVIAVAVICFALLIIHGAARMSSQAKEFAERCAVENGVIVPAQSADICIPKWIIFEESPK